MSVPESDKSELVGSGEIWYRCMYCTRAFKEKSKGKDHVKLMHPQHFEQSTDTTSTSSPPPNSEGHMLSPEILDTQETDNNNIEIENNGKEENPVPVDLPQQTRKLPKQFQCKICGKSSKWLYIIKHHMKVHSEKQFNCNVCNLHYRTSEALSRHRKSRQHQRDIQRLNRRNHTEIKNEASSQVQQQQRELPIGVDPRHMALRRMKGRTPKSYTNKPAKTKCPSPDSPTITMPANIDSQYNVILEPEENLCPSPGSIGLSLQNTKTETHSKVNRKFQCEICSKTFKLAPSFRYHMKFVHSERQFICAVCNIPYRTSLALSIHFKSEHQREPLNQLEAQRQQQQLRLPTEMKSPNKVIRRKKDRTPKRYTTKPAKTGIKCPGPDSPRITMPADVDSQYNVIFETEGNVCSSPCSDLSLQNTETEAQTNPSDKVLIRNFQCEICSKTFKQVQGFDYHMKFVHTERQFKCGVCNIRYRTSGALSRHCKTSGKHQRKAQDQNRHYYQKTVTKSPDSPEDDLRDFSCLHCKITLYGVDRRQEIAHRRSKKHKRNTRSTGGNKNSWSEWRQPRFQAVEADQLISEEVFHEETATANPSPISSDGDPHPHP